MLYDKSAGAFLIENLLYNIIIDYNIELDIIKIISNNRRCEDLFDANLEFFEIVKIIEKKDIAV